jgi:hypothetical protein
LIDKSKDKDKSEPDRFIFNRESLNYYQSLAHFEDDGFQNSIYLLSDMFQT